MAAVAPDYENLPADGLFARLRAARADDWRAHVKHDFVNRLADGTLYEPAFRRYLGQDYLFLIHFARAWALAVYKADGLDDMRAAAATVSAILDVEMKLHVAFCQRWGLSEAELRAQPEARETIAYTRYVLEAGLAGDVLDLHVALAPCVIGYGEIGARLAADAVTGRTETPYAAWIEMYGGAEYQELAGAAIAQLDRLGQSRGADARFDALARTFGEATRLEADFWQMGLDVVG